MRRALTSQDIDTRCLKGTLQEDIQSIINSPRLFSPISISGLGILKGRWKRVYTQYNYEPKKEFNLSKNLISNGVRRRFYIMAKWYHKKNL